ncbi:MAG: hypothetical protein ACK2U9_09940, partial [Anaerolineae bacterium]
MAQEGPANGFVVPFALDERGARADRPLIYRPWGTRTIKLKITARTDMSPLRVRPQGVLPEDAALGICKGYADDDCAFHITWGGGHECGPCVKSRDVLSALETCAPLAAGDQSYLYFNLTHACAEVPPGATVTLRAFECLQFNGKGIERDQARLLLPIEAPPHLPPTQEIIRMVPGEAQETWVASPGRYLPAYDSRWWPSF